MKKRIISAFAAAAFVLSAANVSAEISVQREGGRYIVTVGAEDNDVVTMIAARKGSDIEDDANIAAVKEGTAEEKKVVFEFAFDDSPEADSEGEYTIYITNNSTMERQSADFSHVAEETLKAAQKWLEDCQSAEELKNMLSPDSEYRLAFQSMGIGCGSFDVLEDEWKSQAAKIFTDGRERTAAGMNKAIGAVMLNGKKDADEALLCAQAEFEGILYKDLKDEKEKDWLKKLMADNAPYGGYEDFDGEYETASALYRFAGAKFSEYAGLFEKYESLLKISAYSDYKKYCGLSKEKKAQAGENLIDRQSRSPAEDVETLMKYLKEAVSDLSDSSQGGGGGGGGGNPGSGNSGKTPGSGSDKGAAVIAGPSDGGGDDEKPSFEFNDLNRAQWAADAVLVLAEKQIVSGFGDGSFRPLEPVTREQFIKMIVAALGIHNENAECSFTDTRPGDWHYSYIASAFCEGIASGVTESEFGTGKVLTRQEMAAFAARAADKYMKLEFIREANDFSDREDIAKYAEKSVDSLYRAGVMSGMEDNRFEPLGEANRAQAALVIYNLFVR